MSMRPLTVDLVVWATLAGVFVGVLLLVGYLNRTPTFAEQRAHAELAMLQDCRGWSATGTLHADMRDDVCACVASRTMSFGGVNDSDFLTCRQRVAARMTQHPDLDTAFASNFPQLCGTLEGRISGLPGDGTSQFCQCLSASSAEVPVIEASYAFGGGEPDTDERTSRLRQCTGTLAYGEGWKTTGTGEASMHMPPYLPYRDLVLRCAEDGARFEALSGSAPIADGLEFYDDDDSSFDLGGGSGFVGAPASYGLIEKLAVRPEIRLQTGKSTWRVTLQGFAKAAAAVIQQCPEPEVTASAKVAAPTVGASAHDYPDPWEAADAGFAVLRYADDRNWAGSLVCNPPVTYLSLQGELVESAIARHPDPAGTYLADNVSVALAGDGGTLIEDTVWCDWGANEGDTDSCFVILDKDRLDSLYGSGFLAVTIDGQRLDPVAFGTSPAVQAARPSCYRNTGPLP